MSPPTLIALDWGTTSFRAYRVAADGRVLDTISAPEGILAVKDGKFEEALERLMVGRTTLVIAHRLSTIEHADRVLALEGGRLIEQGKDFSRTPISEVWKTRLPTSLRKPRSAPKEGMAASTSRTTESAKSATVSARSGNACRCSRNRSNCAALRIPESNSWRTGPIITTDFRAVFCEVAGKHLAIADDTSGDEIGIVEHRPERMTKRIAKLATLVDRSRAFRRDVAGDAAGEGELAKQLSEEPHLIIISGIQGQYSFTQLRQRITLTRDFLHRWPAKSKRNHWCTILWH